MKSNFPIALSAALAAVALVSCDRSHGSRKSALERESPAYRAAMEDYRSGRVSRAVEGFRKVCRECPSNASARFQLACLLMDSQKDFAGAYCAFKEYILQQPEGEKTSLAKDRLKICEKELARTLADKFSASSSSTVSAAEVENLRARLKSSLESGDVLKKALEEARRRAGELEERVKHLTKLVSDSPDVDAPPREVADVKTLLDSDGEADAPAPGNDASDLLSAFDADAEAAPPIAQSPGAKEDRDKAKKDAEAAEAARKAEAEKAKARIPDTYVVAEGDTLYKIAVRFYGKASAWRRIRDANRALISNDGRIKAGQKLVMPK